MMVVNALGACHADCPFCAREFWKWMKSRMSQMSMTKYGPSFSEEAVRSVGSRVKKEE